MDDVTRAREWLESADSGDAESLAAQFSDSRKEALDDLRECYKDLGIMTEKWMDACERVTTLEAALRDCVDNLVWCSGSNDFSVDGVARIGWLKGPEQSIKRANTALAGPPKKEKESWSAEDDRMERRIATLTEALNTASCDMADVRNALIRTEQALGGAQVRLCAVIAGYNTEEGK